MSINETVTALTAIHEAIQAGRWNEAALQTMEALGQARLEEEAYEEYLETREGEYVSRAEIEACLQRLEDLPF